MDDRSLVARFSNVHMAFHAGVRRPVWALRGLTMEVPTGAVLGLLFGGHHRGMATLTAIFTSREEDEGGPLDAQ